MPVRLFTSSEIDRHLPAWRESWPQLATLLDQETPASALRRVGLALWREDQLHDAVTLLTAAVSLQSVHAPLWSELAGALHAHGQSAQAEACLQTALKLDSEQPEAWLLLATIAAQDGRHAVAETAFLSALSQAPQLAEASLGLGILYFQQRRFDEAAMRLRLATRIGDHKAAAQALLGQALFQTGDFAAAAAALSAATRLLPDEVALRQKLAMARLLEAAIDKPIEQAMELYDAIAGADGEDRAVVAEKAFHLLSGFGHHPAAIRLAQSRLASAPDDPMQRYLLAAVKGENLDRAPADYLRAYFDRFAENFDRQLVDILGYDVPAKLQALLPAPGPRFRHILDLGCGTGLAGPLFARLGDRLTGVDISAGMLARAAARRLYDDLIESDVLDYLARWPQAFDLVLAADLLIYIGNSTELIDGVASALVSGGLFAFSIETTAVSDYSLLPSGRFAHNPAYIAHLTQRDFVLQEAQSTTLRLEANKPVPGMLFLLRRR